MGQILRYKARQLVSNDLTTDTEDHELARENERLRREVRILKEETDILKKATQFFASQKP